MERESPVGYPPRHGYRSLNPIGRRESRAANNRLPRGRQEEQGANTGADTGPAQRRRRHARGRRGSVHGHERVTAWQDGADAQRKNTRRGFRFVWPSTRAGRRPRPPVANDRLRYRPAFRVPPAVLRAGFLCLVLVDGHNVPLRLVRVQFGRCGVLLPPHTTHLLDHWTGCGSISPRRCGCFVEGNPARFSPFGVGEHVGEHDVLPSTGVAAPDTFIKRDQVKRCLLHLFVFAHRTSSCGQGIGCSACHSRARSCASLRSAGVIRSATASRLGTKNTQRAYAGALRRLDTWRGTAPVDDASLLFMGGLRRSDAVDVYLPSEHDRPDVAAARVAWHAAAPTWDVAHLVCLDETGITTNLLRRYGRAPRGARVHDHAPCGRWQPST